MRKKKYTETSDFRQYKNIKKAKNFHSTFFLLFSDPSNMMYDMLKTHRITLKTQGNCDIIDITSKITTAINNSHITDGTATIFNIGSTAGITTIEFEPGLVNHDIAAAFEKIAPENGRYEHEETWNDDNGHAHVRASLLGPSLVVPFVEKQLTLGTWQQIVLIDFDTRPRNRTIICQIMGQ
jgi:secondary thiamine-phosphate synthase enzyme